MFTSTMDHVRGSWRLLVKEVMAFGIVGAIAFVIDFGLYNLLFTNGVGTLTANTVSTIVATTFAYLGNLNWSFSHRARRTLAREATYFFGINGLALAGGVLIMAFFAYPLHYKYDQFAMNLVKMATIVLGTIFRFWAYKRFVFLHPDRVAHGLPDEDEEEDFISAS